MDAALTSQTHRSRGRYFHGVAAVSAATVLAPGSLNRSEAQSSGGNVTPHRFSGWSSSMAHSCTPGDCSHASTTLAFCFLLVWGMVISTSLHVTRCLPVWTLAPCLLTIKVVAHTLKERPCESVPSRTSGTLRITRVLLRRFTVAGDVTLLILEAREPRPSRHFDPGLPSPPETVLESKHELNPASENL
jgi:hypothetical protein